MLIVRFGGRFMTARKKINDKRRFLYIIPVIFWMAFIFYMSAKNAEASSSLSGGITERLGDVFEVIRNDTPVERESFMSAFETIIRKLAHMAEYGVLFGLVLLAVKKVSYASKRAYFYILSLVICFLYACTDEFHQLFVPGRDGNVVDVLIDMSGALTCMIGGLAIKNSKWRIIIGFMVAFATLALFLFLIFYDFM